MGRIIFSTDGPIAIIALDNPGKHNAVDAQMREELTAAYQRVEDEESLRVAIICGAEGGSFCAGGSIDGYLEGNAIGPGAAHLPRIPRPYPSKKPYIAAICGYALGGGFALALACDLRVAGKGARMGPTGLTLGAVQGAQTISRLTRLVGASRALEVLLLSQRLSGEKAGELGIVNKVIEDAEVMNAALAWAQTLAGFSPWTLSMTKKLVYEAQHLPLQDAIDWEDRVATEAYQRPEALEGFQAFKQGRKPSF